MNQCKAIHYKKNKQYKKKKYYRDNVPNKQKKKVLGLLYAITMEFSLWLGAIKIIIIKIMHRFK